MKSLFTLFACLFFTFSLFSQNGISLSGTIVDEATEEPVEFATVRLLNTKDSTLISGTSTNQRGVFSLNNLVKGSYLLHVAYIGYNNVYKPVSVSGDKTNETTGKISLTLNDILLDETLITAKAPEMIVKEDTVEYNADSYKVTPNAVVEDLLKKLPGAEVDKDGNITINGKEIKKILVDGEEFFSDDPKVASKNLPAEMVKKVQVYDRKSDLARLTGFDDGDESTVINLSVKEGMKRGSFGNVMGGFGSDLGEHDNDLRYETGAFLNHMQNNERYSLMINVNNTNNRGSDDLGAQRFGEMRNMRRGAGGIVSSQLYGFNMNKKFTPEFTFNSDVSFNSQDRTSNSRSETLYDIAYDRETGDSIQVKDRTASWNNDLSENFGLNFRLEWKPDTNTTVFFRPNFSYNNSRSRQDRDFDRLDMLTGDTLYTGESNSFSQGEGYQFGGTLDYSRKLNKPGRVLSFSLSGNYNTSYSHEDYDYNKRLYEEGVFDRDSIVNQRSENDNNSTNLTAYLSYVEPIGNNNYLQFAYRIRQLKSENINSTYDLIDTIPGLNPFEKYARLNSDQSRSNERTATEQRVTLSFKSVREKYNYTIGINMDPSYSDNKTYLPYPSLIEDILIEEGYDYRYKNERGDSLQRRIKQDVINFSPTLNFNYLFGQRTNLRIDYNGNTSQPSANQLSIYDISDPLNVVIGNPDLKPSYSNNFTARFNKYLPETQTFYNIFLRGNLSFNDIISVRTRDLNGNSTTTYRNVNGNWNADLRVMFNTPLRNKKFTIGSNAGFSMNNAKSYTNNALNTRQTLTLTDRSQANYRSDLFDLGVNASITYRKINNELQPQNDEENVNWVLGGYTTWYLPKDFIIETDINWDGRSGYARGYNTHTTMWNAALTKQLFDKKAGAGIIKIKIYDILQENKSFSYTVGNDYTRNTESTTLPSYFMCSFIYKFKIFPGGGGASPEDMMGPGRGNRRGPGEGGGRPMGGPGGGRGGF